MKAAQIPTRKVTPMGEWPSAAGRLRDDDDVRERNATVGKKFDGRFEIEADVPVPVGQARSSALYEALGALEPGESIMFKGRKTAVVPSKAKAIWPTRFFIARAVAGGVRIWRKN